MAQELHIRTARAEDAAALLHIYGNYVRNTAVTFEWNVPTVREFSERITRTLRRYPYLVAERSGTIVGYAYAGTFKERAAYRWSAELSVYVDVDARHGGIGRALYTALEDALQSMGVQNLYACIAYPEAEDEYLTFDSVRFHERLGFAICGTFTRCSYKFDRWYGMVWMEKLIGDHGTNQPPVKPFPALGMR